MPKFFAPIIAFALIPCLLADPATATVIARQRGAAYEGPTGFCVPRTAGLFDRQALALGLLVMLHEYGWATRARCSKIALLASGSKSASPHGVTRRGLERETWSIRALLEAAKAAGIRGKVIARLGGVSESTVGQVRNGQKVPGTKTVRKLLKGLEAAIRPGRPHGRVTDEEFEALSQDMREVRRMGHPNSDIQQKAKLGRTMTRQIAAGNRRPSRATFNVLRKVIDNLLASPSPRDIVRVVTDEIRLASRIMIPRWVIAETLKISEGYLTRIVNEKAPLSFVRARKMLAILKRAKLISAAA